MLQYESGSRKVQALRLVESCGTKEVAGADHQRCRLYGCICFKNSEAAAQRERRYGHSEKKIMKTSFCLFSSNLGWEKSKPDIREVFQAGWWWLPQNDSGRVLERICQWRRRCTVNACFSGRSQSPLQMLQNEVCLDQTSTGIRNQQVLLERRPHISAAFVTFTTAWGGSACQGTVPLQENSC